MNEAGNLQDLTAMLDHCVKCGMCLPECPTYRLAMDESESPRGRLALIEGVVDGRLRPDRRLSAHLDSCLGCRRCERICPSKVAYGAILDTARGMLADRANAGIPATGPTRLGMQARLARALPTILSRPFGRTHRLHRLARALPVSRRAPSAGAHTVANPRGHVGLFAGCTGAALQPDALHAAIALLNHAGFTVTVPAPAHCCGALAAHAGRTREALALARTNRDLFPSGLDAIVSIASGCGTHIDEYRPPPTVPHRDICHFLIDGGGLDGADFAALHAKVLLHTPCSVENLYRGARWARDLVALIPGLRVVDVDDAGQCCGAAGDYLLRHPDTANRLREPIIGQAGEHDADILLSGNVGCAMHIAEGLAASGMDVQVAHPVELLARQLKRGAGT